MPGVFLSYRRADTDWSTRLARSLANRFGKDLVFLDVEDIQPGDRWRGRVRSAIATAEVVIVAIGPGWVTDQRLQDPQDVLRGEVRQALQLDKTIIPVLLGGAHMPVSERLPIDLSGLTEHQSTTLRDDSWNDDLSRLLERVRAVLLPQSSSEPLSQVQDELDRLQGRFFALLEQDRLADALEVAQTTLTTLNRVSPLYPQDVYLQTARGYTHKNCAIALRDFGRDAEAQTHLEAADAVFSTLLTEYPENPAAWDGKGSVLAVGGDLEASLPYFDRALELKPDYAEARSNRELIRGALAHSVEAEHRADP